MLQRTACKEILLTCSTQWTLQSCHRNNRVALYAHDYKVYRIFALL